MRLASFRRMRRPAPPAGARALTLFALAAGALVLGSDPALATTDTTFAGAARYGEDHRRGPPAGSLPRRWRWVRR